MIKTLSQLPDPTWGIDGTTIWHEIAKSAVDLNTNDRYWSSWKIPLSAEVLYTIYSGTREATIHGLSALNITNENELAMIASDVNGSALPGVLKTLELRNKLQKDIDLSVMHDELSAIVGNDTERAGEEDGILRLAGNVMATKDDVFKIGSEPDEVRPNINCDNFKETSATVVPNARAVYEFTKESLPILIAPKSGFDTLYISEAGHTAEYHDPENAIKKETVPHDAYIFTINNSSTQSNEWEAPASGWFTCFGWLSEFATGSVANYQRWVALEGNLNGNMPVDPATGERPPNWCILQLQPFIPNTYISYVGFGVPVKKGLMLRIKTGFAVGASSGNYAMSNLNTRSSLANHIANAFVGGVYSC